MYTYVYIYIYIYMRLRSLNKRATNTWKNISTTVAFGPSSVINPKPVTPSGPFCIRTQQIKPLILKGSAGRAEP